jgi:hypothetical protein
MPVPNDLDLVNLSAAIYDSGSKWDHFDPGAIDDEVCWALKHLDGFDVVVFRGSITALDWWLDLEFEPIETRIGTVHSGFFTGMEQMWSEVKPMLKQPVMITGHSLGAARADMLCGLMAADKAPVAHSAVFGEPRPGLSDFAHTLSKIDRVAYCNGDKHGHDRVCDVPLRLQQIADLDFIHPKRLVLVTAEPEGNFFATHGLFAWHHISLYQKAIAAHLGVKS